MIFKKTILSILFLFGLLLGLYSQPREIHIEGQDQLRYTVETIKAEPGELLKITLKTISSIDKSQMAHNWVLLKQGTDALDFVSKGLSHEKNDFSISASISVLFCIICSACPPKVIISTPAVFALRSPTWTGIDSTSS